MDEDGWKLAVGFVEVAALAYAADALAPVGDADLVMDSPALAPKELVTVPPSGDCELATSPNGV